MKNLVNILIDVCSFPITAIIYLLVWPALLFIWLINKYEANRNDFNSFIAVLSAELIWLFGLWLLMKVFL